MATNAAIVNLHVDQALSSPLFQKAERQARFLRFVVDAALQSPEATLKEFDIGIAVYDRGSNYDPRTDPIVRVEAARLRARLREYYEVSPPQHVRIEIPKGHYVPRFISVEGEPAKVASDLSMLIPRFRSLSSDPGDQNFCDGLTEEMVHKLAQDRRIRVITPLAAAWLEQGDRPKPRFLLEASVRRAGAEIRVTVHLTELIAASATHLSKIYEATITDVFAAQEWLAEEIRRDICAALHLGDIDRESMD